MTATKLNAAVVGLGVGEQHARAYLEHDSVGSVTLFDIDKTRAKSIAEKLGGLRVVKSYETILSDDSIQLVSIASYDGDHAAQVVKALQAGKHVFVEKPLARSFEEIQSIKEALQKSGKKLHLDANFVLRRAPFYQWLKERIQDRSIGDIYAVDGDYLYGRLHKITHGWRGREEDYSPLHGGAVHMLDLFLWMFEDRPATVSAMGNKVVTKGNGYRYEDYAALQFVCENGLAGRFSVHLGCVHRHQHVFKVYGSNGTILYDDAGARIHWTRDEDVTAFTLNNNPLPESKKVIAGRFVDAILSEKNNDEDVKRLFDGISILSAARESLRTGKTVEVNYL
ncbi:Gfo/Idh/MocA family oxidoreductase [bacterium]|nr:Gfo/Idh/MocA family oxidoreductase [bacterium]